MDASAMMRSDGPAERNAYSVKNGCSRLPGGPMKSRRWRAVLCTVFAACALAGCVDDVVDASAAPDAGVRGIGFSVNGSPDDFEDGTTQGWVIDPLQLDFVPAVLRPQNVATGGPAGAGDGFLLLASSGMSGGGGILDVVNVTQWSGNYTGVSAITAQVKNFGPSDVLLRVGFDNRTMAPAPVEVTDIAFSSTPVFLPAGSDWTTVTFPVTPADLTAALGTVGNALATARLLRVYHSPTAAYPDVVDNPVMRIATTVGIDNITNTGTLVPHSNTPVGSNVAVELATTLPDGTSVFVPLTFEQIVVAGTTMVTTSSSGPAPPAGYKTTTPLYYEVTSTASFSGNVRICLPWTDGAFANETNVQLFHHAASGWQNVTDAASRNVVNNRICGETASLSPFALFEVKRAFGGFLSPIDAAVVNEVRAGAAVPVKFSLGGDYGLSVFAAGYPSAEPVECTSGLPMGQVTETVTAGASTLSYDATTDVYTYVWKTDRAWKDTCRLLLLRFDDGETYTARFAVR
jgi:hypothetical protein